MGNSPCAFIETDEEYKNISVTTRGTDAQKAFGVNNSMMLIYTICTAQHNTLLVHSSVVENSGKAYMFLGKSGQGKSTHSDMWVKHIEGSTLINDDNPVIRIADDGTPIVYGSPGAANARYTKTCNTPLAALQPLSRRRRTASRGKKYPWHSVYC